ncbi:SulP family inorganic anion transporter [Silvanigrella aquatica]|uniref:SLC26A/SulP transporter domain-containing protein n=1 Tax=Silvanigrella aquatica TaxID=1915309 RepID=A0A1L4D366_9BACT|nr:SulP family inorganic anion transporter [Silvanigrella aquatica]APJ04646.1 hypothetical protein AXG55_12325 [Silvanigrella aquatica]
MKKIIELKKYNQTSITKNLNKKKNYQGNFKENFLELKENWLEVLKGKSILQDTLSAITVASVALPLNIALAVACGLPASSGLIAGAIGGGLAAIFGGSSLQVTGPAAALNVMVLAITKDYGAIGVCFACIIIGIIQLVLSYLSAGRFIKYVPEAVLAGFTTGVGIKLLDSQIPELFGFDYTVMQLLNMMSHPIWLTEVSWIAVVCGLFVALFVTSCRQFKQFPASFVGIVIITALAIHLNWNVERVGVISAILPSPSFPLINSEKFMSLIIATIPLAFLASIETLLSAQAVDRISNSKKEHNSNLELFGQGLGNFGSGLVGGMPVSGVIVRSTVNVQSGAKTRLSSLLHSVLIIASIIYFSEIMSSIPLAALAGLLCVVGIRLIEVKVFFHLIKTSKLESFAFLSAAIGTVVGYLLSGIFIGCFLFFLEKWLNKPLELNKKKESLRINRRAIINSSIRENLSKKPTHFELDSEKISWLSQIRDKASIAASSFVHQKASIIGKVILGEHVHIAAESSIRADEGTPFYIGSNSNIQDGVVIHALKEKWISVSGEDWAVYIGENVSVAHQALVHGPCYIGNNSFIGFQAIVHDSVVGSHCYIGIGAIVVSVEIPDGRYVPHGMVVDSIDKVDLLPLVTDSHKHFNEDVVDVNKGLVVAYKKFSGQSLNSTNINMNTLKKLITANDKF